MTKIDPYPPQPAFSTGVRCKCPRCGRGRLFDGYLALAKRCPVCDLDYGFADSGDGPMVFIILIAGFVIAAAALFVEVSYQPPYWLHAVLWIPLAIALPLVLLRPFKGVFVALQYVNKARESRFG